MKAKVILMPHTHWDAEWYFTTSDTKVLLVNHMNDAIKKLIKQKATFSWDGQVYPLQQYLQIEDNQLVKKMVAKGKIKIGPWYTQPHARQIHPENYYRNLEYGKALAKKWKSKEKHALMSDIFGFADQVPQILKNNGIDSVFFMRGWEPALTAGFSEFIWKAPSGDQIFAKSFENGYGNAKFLSLNPQTIRQQYIPIAQNDLKRSKSNVALMLHGGDQMYLRDNLAKIIKKVNKYDQVKWEIGDLTKYMKQVRKAKIINKLPIYLGELVKPYQNRIHLTSYSHRQDIKKLISKLEYDLVNTIEVLNVLGVKNGLQDYSSLIYQAWEKLFLATAHDAAAGCNSDEVNASIKTRLHEALQMILALENLIKRQLISSNQVQENEILVINTLTQVGELSCDVHFTALNKNVTLAHPEAQALVYDCQKLQGGKQVKLTIAGEKEVDLPSYYLLKAKVFIQEAKPLSFLKLKIVPSQVVIEKNTPLALALKQSLKLRYQANDGDAYDFSPPNKELEEIIPITGNVKIKKASAISYGILKFSHQVFANWLNPQEKILQNYELTFTKWPNKRIDLKLSVNNIVKNVRISLVVPSKEILTSTLVRTMFYQKVYRNQKIANDWAKKYREYPANIFPFTGWVTAGKINFYSRELREYEYNENQLMVALFRTNGYLGKNNLKWRPGRASGVNDMMIATPEAQLFQKLSFNFALAPTNMPVSFLDYVTRIPTYQKQNLAHHLERLQRFNLPFQKIKNLQTIKLKLLAQLEVSAFYIFERNLYLRIFNNSAQHQKPLLQIFNYHKELQFKPWQIQTIKIPSHEWK